jgi:hypothetical protein
MASLRQLTLQRTQADADARRKAWLEFSANQELHKTYGVKPNELEALKREALLGDLRSNEEFITVLSLLRRGQRPS